MNTIQTALTATETAQEYVPLVFTHPDGSQTLVSLWLPPGVVPANAMLATRPSPSASWGPPERVDTL